jgi:sugar lactone lactonase YvrE
MRRIALLATVTALLATATAGATSMVFPEVIKLPNGWRPEGIATGPLGTFYVGSLATGAVWRGHVLTGNGAPVVPPQAGRIAVGVDYDRGRLFVAGGGAGDGYVYNAFTGAPIASYDFTSGPVGTTFVNDVIVTRTAAWFTDSRRAFLYKVPLGQFGAPGASFEAVPLTGITVNPAVNNVNGIDATPDGKTLIVVQSNLGKLFTVDLTGEADEIELTGGDALNGDGIHLDGKKLYVVKNFQNRVAVIELEQDLGSGTVVRHITHPEFKIPTTIDEFGLWLYAVNARFDVPPADQPTTEYTVVRVLKDFG